MDTRFGRTQYGASTGYVTIAGMALCVASAQGTMVVQPQFLPAVASAYATGTGAFKAIVSFAPIQAAAYANGSGRLTGDFLLHPLPANGYAVPPPVDLTVGTLAGGTANASATATGFGRLLVRIRPMHAHANATADGVDPAIYGNLKPGTAYAYATGLGSTNHLYFGNATATATATGTCVYRRGYNGIGNAVATGSNTAVVYTAGAAGTALAGASGYGYPNFIVNGVKQWHLDGVGLATASLSPTNPLIYRTVTAYGFAAMQGTAVYIRGYLGIGTAVAAGYADLFTVHTIAYGEVAASTAVATGRMTLGAMVKTSGSPAIATGIGSCLVSSTKIYGLPANGVATITGQASTKSTKAYPDDGIGNAYGFGRMSRRRIHSPLQGAATAELHGGFSVTLAGYGVAVGTSNAHATAYIRKTISGTASATAVGNVSNFTYEFHTAIPAVAVAIVTGTIKRKVIGAGLANATATCSGYEQINDLSRAPVSRTVFVIGEPRLITLPLTSRVIIV